MNSAQSRIADVPPEVCAVVVNYNAGHHLLQCVRALLGESRLGHIWVVDNASADGSLEAVAALASKTERISIMRNAANLGFGAGNNQALRARPSADWLLVNPDCTLATGAVAHFIACREAHARGGLFGGLVRNPDGSEQRGCRRALPTIGTSLLRTLGVRRLFGRRRWNDFDYTDEDLPTAPVRVEAVSGALMYLRSDAIREVGIFDEGYFLHCEDLDICRRMADKGWEVWFVPGAEAVHVQGTSSRRAPLFVHWHKHRGMWRYYRKFEAPTHNPLFNLAVGAGIWLRFAVTASALCIPNVMRRFALGRR